MIKNNNTSVILNLAKNSYKNNRSRNSLLIGAISFAVILLFCITSISFAQVDSEYLMYARKSGSLATVYLDRPTAEQYKQAKTLDCLEIVGKESSVGMGEKDNHQLFIGKVVDDVAYKELYRPAFSNIHGGYPTQENEVMLPMKVLEELGIKPKIGMEIELTLRDDKDNTKDEIFILSGYFEEYVDSHMSLPSAFFSIPYLEKSGRSLNQSDLLIMKQQDHLLFEEIESILYEKIETIDDIQQFVAADTLTYAAVQTVYGNYDTAIMLCAIIVISVFLLINNIMQISLEKSVRELGLLRTIGTTKKQIFLILKKQIIRIVATGIVLGSSLSFMIVRFLLPLLLSGLTTNEGVAIGEVITIRWWLLFIVIGFVGIISMISMLLPLKVVYAISPKDALYYTYGKNKISSKEIQTKKSISIRKMAWRNISKNRGRFFKTIISLFVASLLSIGSIMAIQILDYSNMYKNEADFALTEWNMNASNFISEDTYLSESFINELKKIDGITSMDTTYQAYVHLNINDKVWKPLQKAEGEIEEERQVYVSGLRIVDNDEIQKFESFIKENKLDIDIESFVRGETVFNLQHHVFSEKMEKEAKEVNGELVTIYNRKDEELAKFTFGGYLDLQMRGFPNFKNMSTNTTYYPYILISESGFEKLGIDKEVNRVYIFVEEGKEIEVHNIINEIMRLQNKDFTQEALPKIEVFAKYVAEKEAIDYINSIKILLYSMSFILFGMAIFNYFNVMHTSLTNRRRELVMLESIGMTRTQLRKLLVWEGILYSLVVIALLISIGSGFLYFISNFIQAGQAKIVFTYPTTAVIMLVAIITIISVMLPILIYRRVEKQSIVERLSE
ncbi:putative ABC transport system permease protein [Breznakia sp. PF5-3]|uniref:ABC transporter permease n=1 Tax=unclassified Breznakia TaxID=2623764 RepID=UPI002405A31E|nr:MULTISPECIES: FtsX-like permease family protein [unclassified Breznakia]MDF9825702.1 putative ABC transport system permease protein [Breznakia sp. PM6-1]MDF9836536.1 putative ABC transport system permease protein [Breznakia sp. PF5-3]MDF9838770.1 putative ABC transport system permease protein [Breznakia sp. PFB2-8]MDF9860796.1 putative ABC transport system permease protein [Breznakia sp. PH5-24]